MSEIKKSFKGMYEGKNVLVTGHTGFKGAWLCEWLVTLGAKVTGFSNGIPTTPSLFEQLGLQDRIYHTIGDICDLEAVRSVVARSKPDFIFHLAAQPLVRLSYAQPVETFSTNIMGTAYVLEAVRLLFEKPVGAMPENIAVVLVTTDKCYENREWIHAYRENDQLGGYDPYSASKGAAEIVLDAYRRSYFSQPGCPVRIASVRAGNVIGGGDWALDRIVPDSIRALRLSLPIRVRNPRSTRPWQHVLEPLSGYLWLGSRLLDASASDPRRPLTTAFNFGPNLASNRRVSDLIKEILLHWPGSWEDASSGDAPHEAGLLNLSTEKAFHLLGWAPSFDFHEAVLRTIQWYRKEELKTGSAIALTREQISGYWSRALTQKQPWACV